MLLKYSQEDLWMSRYNLLHNYFSILQVETLTEDIKFIEDLLKLPPVWDVQQQIIANGEMNKILPTSEDGENLVYRANAFDKEFTYPEYMSQLTRLEIDMLYTVFYNDFNVFGYQPCEGLAVT